MIAAHICRNDVHIYASHLPLYIRYRNFRVITVFSRTVHLVGSTDRLVQRHIVDVVARVVGVVGIVVVRFIHPRLAEERRQFLEQTEGRTNYYTIEDIRLEASPIVHTRDHSS